MDPQTLGRTLLLTTTRRLEHRVWRYPPNPPALSQTKNRAWEHPASICLSGVAGAVGAPLGLLLPNPTASFRTNKLSPRTCGLNFFVGVAGFEPTASSSRTTRATKLRHTP